VPELPEVETIRRGLVGRVTGQSVSAVVTRDCRVFQGPPGELEGLVSQRIQGIDRRAKFLHFEFERNDLVIHLGMTGQLTLRDVRQPDSQGFQRHETTGLQRIRQHAPDRHTHFQLHLDGGQQLLYRDIRMFGKIHFLSKESGELKVMFSKLGMEPLSEQYNYGTFESCLRSRSLRVKSFLLNQQFVAGIGNIYADEALFLAGIRPTVRVSRLSRKAKKALFEAIPEVLEAGIRFGGTSMRDFINTDGEVGSNQEELMVYGRKGLPCYRCGHPVKKIVVSQRGTHYCPRCQRAS
jgi:formamidopyrimidine-DNA glycosylase